MDRSPSSRRPPKPKNKKSTTPGKNRRRSPNLQRDVTDPQQMKSVIHLAREKFGGIDGVIHAAGLADGGMIPLRTRETTEPVLAAKIKGTLVLDQVLKHEPLDFFVLCSSISAVLGLFGQVGYCAANAFLDAFAQQKTPGDGIFTLSINWDFWQEVGMGVETVKQLKENKNIIDAEMLLQRGILSSQGIEVFNRVLPAGYPRLSYPPGIYSTGSKRLPLRQQPAPKKV